jgi:hypothetical protein
MLHQLGFDFLILNKEEESECIISVQKVLVDDVPFAGVVDAMPRRLVISVLSILSCIFSSTPTIKSLPTFWDMER